MIGFLGIGRHHRLRSLLSAYIDGEVSETEAGVVEEHLAGCAECQHEMESLRATVDLLGQMPELPLPHSFTLSAAPADIVPKRPFTWAPALATSLAGLLLVALLAGDAFGVVEQTRQREVAELAAPAPAPAAAPEAAAAPAALQAPAAPEAPFAAPPTGALEAAAPVAVAAAVPALVATPVPAAAPPPVLAAAAAPAPLAPTAAAPTAPDAEAMPAPAAARAAPARPLAEGADQPAAETMVAAQTATSEEDGGADATAKALEQPVEPSPPIPEDAPGDAGPPSGEPEAQGGLVLPLRELQLALGVLVVVLVAFTVWSLRRARRWSP